MKRISVVICTHNRARLLEGALESLCFAERPEQWDWEVVVVVNDRRDESRHVVDRFRNRLPIICVNEDRPGTSYARNRGIDVASGDVVIWIDDDVQVEREWLRAYEYAFCRWPEATVFGGAILPKFEGTPPVWLQQAWHLCDSAFAARRIPEADAPILLTANYPPYGANFAIRAAAQRRFRYDPRLGPRPGKWIENGDETEVIRSILASGASGRWVRAAVVHHIMPQERQTIRYVRHYYESCGRLLALQTKGAQFMPSVANRWRGMREVIAAETRFRWLKAFAGPTQWVPALVSAATARGKWIGRHSCDHIT